MKKIQKTLAFLISLVLLTCLDASTKVTETPAIVTYGPTYICHSAKQEISVQNQKELPIFQKKLNYVPAYTQEERLLAQLLEAEAGNQGVRGKQLVADVVLNRVGHDSFPDSIKSVIFQNRQFSCINDGGFAKAGKRISEESLQAARKEMTGPRIDTKILYFNSGSHCMNGRHPWKYKDHWFAY